MEIQPPPTGQPAKLRHRGRVIAASVVVLALLAAAGGYVLLRDHEQPTAAKKAKKVTISGKLLLADTVVVTTHFAWDMPNQAREVCVGQGAYSDIAEGTPVTIRDADGTAVAVTKLGTGMAEGFGEVFGLGPEVPSRCAFPFAAINVPAGGFYEVQVGTRNAETFSSSTATAGQMVIRLGE